MTQQLTFIGGSGRRLAALLFALLVFLGSVGAARPVTLAMSAQPDTLDPQVTAATAAFQVGRSIYDTLVMVGPDGALTPGLATSWEVSGDALTYTFELAEAAFHDGSAFTSADVVASLNRIRDPELGSPKLPEFEKIVSVEPLGERSVRVTLAEPQPAFLATLASGWGAVLPAAKLKAGHDFGNRPVGTGPFVFERWVRDSAITLSANPDYFLGAPKVEGVVIRFVTDSAVQLQGLVAGEFDIIDTVAEADRPQVEADPALKLVREPSGLVLVAGLNTRNAPLDDPRVRRALNLAVDTEVVMEVAYAGGHQVGTFMEAGSPWYPATVEPFPFDPEGAKALLAEAGFGNGFKLNMVLPQPYEEHLRAGQVVQDYLSAVGVNAQISIVEWGVWLSEVYGGPREFDITVVGHTGKLDPSGRLAGLGVPERNYTGLDDSELAELIARADVTADEAVRRELYAEALELIHEEAPFIFFGTPDRVYARSAAVEGFWMTPLLDTFVFAETTLE